MPEINYLAVLVAGVATWIIGALWYSPVLFAKPWMAAHGYTPEKMQGMKDGMMRAFIGSFICYLITAAVLSVFLSMTGSVGIGAGIKLGVLCWVGFSAALFLTQNLYSDKPLTVFLIDTGYHLVFLIVMGAILGAWR